MGRKSKYMYEVKIKTIKRIMEGKISTKGASRETGASDRIIREWVSKYKSQGDKGLKDSQTHEQYTAEDKESAVKAYIKGKRSILSVCEEYKIRSTYQLRDWIKKYNSHKRLKPTGMGAVAVAKGRKTSFEERVEIVKASIESGYNYNETAEAHQVSYQQARSWTVKYEQYGIEALQDRRGRRKPESEMTAYEKLKTENKMLEARNRRLMLENEFLKKLKELEGGGA